MAAPDANDADVTRSSDPRLVASRIFIGNLPTDRCSQAELKDYFQKYGVVLGVSLFKGFGFVQFRELVDAETAVNNEHGKYFQGQKMDIRLASEGRKKREIDFRPPPPHHQPPPRGPDPRDRGLDFDPRDREPPMRRPLSPGPDPYRPPPIQQPHYGVSPFDRHGQPLDPYFKQQHPGIHHDLHHQAHPVDVLASMSSRGPNQSFVGAPSMAHLPSPTQTYPHGAPVHPSLPLVPQPGGHGQGPPSGVLGAGEPVKQPEPFAPPIKKTDIGIERPYDCAILVSDKNHRSYAEMVERRLLELNLSVDLLFLIQQDALPKLVETFSHKGLLYLIIIQKQHEEHKSVTVNILHGTPQEHRNMPLEDALLMMSRDFNGYLSKLRCGSEQPSLNFLLHLISDGKNLSAGELERAIQHLTDRKNQLVGVTVPPNQQQNVPTAPVVAPPATPAAAPLAPKGEEKESNSAVDLQKKIMSILSGSGGGGGGAAATNKPVQPVSTADAPPAKMPALSTRPGLMGAAPPSTTVSQGSIDIHKTLNNLLQNRDALKNILPGGQQAQNGPQSGYQGSAAAVSQAQPTTTHPLNPYDSRAMSTTSAGAQQRKLFSNYVE